MKFATKCQLCQRNGHTAKDCWSRYQTNKGPSGPCQICNSPTHVATQCRCVKFTPQRMSDNPGLVRTYAAAELKDKSRQSTGLRYNGHSPSKYDHRTYGGPKAPNHSLHQHEIIVLNEKTRCGWLGRKFALLAIVSLAKIQLKSAKTMLFESSNFLYDINVDSFTGCHSRLCIYIYMFISELNKLVPTKIDTGSDISIFPGHLSEGQDDIEPLCESFDATAANGTTICLDKNVTFTLQCKNFSIQHKFYLSDDINKCLLGLDFLLDNNAVLDTKGRVLIIDDKVIPLLAEPHFSGVNVYCADKIARAPLSETSVTCTKLPLKWCQYWGFQFFPAVRKTAFEIRSSSVQDDGAVILNVFNNPIDTTHVHKGRRLVHAHPLTDCDIQ